VAGNQQAGKAGNCSGLPPKRIRDYAVWEFSSATKSHGSWIERYASLRMAVLA